MIYSDQGELDTFHGFQDNTGQIIANDCATGSAHYVSLRWKRQDTLHSNLNAEVHWHRHMEDVYCGCAMILHMRGHAFSPASSC
eukprot:scaffold7330_cov146-Cylindrotheca_fusiformis.AAC.13